MANSSIDPFVNALALEGHYVRITANKHAENLRILEIKLYLIKWPALWMLLCSSNADNAIMNEGYHHSLLEFQRPSMAISIYQL